MDNTFYTTRATNIDLKFVVIILHVCKCFSLKQNVFRRNIFDVLFSKNRIELLDGIKYHRV